MQSPAEKRYATLGRSVRYEHASLIIELGRMISFEFFTRVVSEALSQPRLVLLPTTRVAELRGWDSLANIDVLLALEAQLGVEFHYTELRHLQTVSDYLELIDSRRLLLQ